MRTPNYSRLARRLKLMAHPERLRILDALRRNPECVCHLEALLQRSQPYVSQQVRTLHRAGMVKAEKQGLNVFYRIADLELLAWLERILGPADVKIGDSGQRRRLPGCVCPQCQPAPEPIALQVAETNGEHWR